MEPKIVTEADRLQKMAADAFYRLREVQRLYSEMQDHLNAALDQVLLLKQQTNGSKPPAPDADDTQEITPPANNSQPAPALSPLAALRAVVDLENFVILDTETTGLRDGEICQIAIVDHKGHTLLHQLVKPVGTIPPDAQRIHGISNDQVKDALGWADVAPRVKDILTGKDVIVYNAVYDRKMMHKSAEYAGVEKIDWKTLSPWYCAMEAYAEFYGDWNDYHQSYRWQRLSVAAERCGVAVKDAHNALGDCLMTLGVVRHMQQS